MPVLSLSVFGDAAFPHSWFFFLLKENKTLPKGKYKHMNSISLKVEVVSRPFPPVIKSRAAADRDG